jgi:hypothetical protein
MTPRIGRPRRGEERRVTLAVTVDPLTRRILRRLAREDADSIGGILDGLAKRAERERLAIAK